MLQFEAGCPWWRRQRRGLQALCSHHGSSLRVSVVSIQADGRAIMVRHICSMCLRVPSSMNATRCVCVHAHTSKPRTEMRTYRSHRGCSPSSSRRKGSPRSARGSALQGYAPLCVHRSTTSRAKHIHAAGRQWANPWRKDGHLGRARCALGKAVRTSLGREHVGASPLGAVRRTEAVGQDPKHRARWGGELPQIDRWLGTVCTVVPGQRQAKFCHAANACNRDATAHRGAV